MAASPCWAKLPIEPELISVSVALSNPVRSISTVLTDGMLVHRGLPTGLNSPAPIYTAYLGEGRVL